MEDLKSKILWGLALAAGVALLAVLWPSQAGDEQEQQAIAEGRTIVVYWDRLTGHEHQMRRDLIDEFNKSQDEIYVRALPIGYYQAMEKILTSTAAGAPPDLCSLDTPLMAQLAPQGVLTPLEDFMAEVPEMAKENYYPHVWAMAELDGHVYGVPTSADSYCLLWNKALFRKAGLDPERPPRTIAELQDYSAKLTIRSESGAIRQMGMLPWLPWDLTHMWGAVFGGKYYDPATERFNLTGDPGAIAGFRFQAEFVHNPGDPNPPAWASEASDLQSFFTSRGEYMSANSPFYTGRVAMITDGEWQVTFVEKYAPNLDWGVAPLPEAPGVGPVGYCPVAMVDCIPSTSKNKEAAKKFLRWFSSSRPNGGTSPASDYCYMVHNLPVRMAEAAQERFSGDPKFKVFVDQMTQKTVSTFPTTGTTQFMLDQLERQRERAAFGETTPEEAAAAVERDANKQLDRMRELAARGAR